MTYTAIDTILAPTICASGSIRQTEYWNRRRNGSTYWHNENDVMKFITLNENVSGLVVSYKLS